MVSAQRDFAKALLRVTYPTSERHSVMKTLFLAWQDKRVRGDQEDGSRAWFPIGRLDAEPDDAHYRFAYTRGVLQAKEKAGFQPLEAFPKFEALYESAELFPLFQNRLISTKREDYAEYLHRLDLSPGADPFEIFAISGGGKQTDNLEVFPKIQTRRDGSFACKFFLHGWRHVNAAIARASSDVVSRRSPASVHRTE